MKLTTLFFFSDINLFLPEFLIAICSLLVIAFTSPTITSVISGNKIYHTPSRGILIFCTILFFLLGLLYFFSDVSYAVDSWELFETSPGIVKIKIFFLMLVTLCLPAVFEAAEIANLRIFDVLSLLLSCVLSSLLIISAKNFISLYLCFEFQALTFYTLAGLARNSIHSSEAGLKYFVSSAVMSCLFLAGIFTIYTCLGTLDFEQIESSILLMQVFPSLHSKFLYILLIIGCLFILSAMAFKMVVAPFHVWQAQVYEGSPLCATIIFNVLSKIIIFIPLMRLVKCFDTFFPWLYLFFLGIGCVTLAWGAYKSFMSNRLKNLLIYSSVNQIGLPISIVGLSSLEARIAIFFFLVVYSLTSILSWSLYVQLIRCQIIQKNFNESYKLKAEVHAPIFLSSLRGLWWSNRSLAIKLNFLFFSLSGIPFLLGFLSKSYIYFILLSANEFMLFGLIFIIFVNCFSTYYYIRIIKILFEPQVDNVVSYAFSNDNFLFKYMINLVDYMIIFFLSIILFFSEFIFFICTDMALSFLPF